MQAQDDDELDTWRMMSKDEGEEDDVDFAAIMKQASTRDDWAADVLSVIDKVLEIADQTRGSNIKQEHDRKMVKSAAWMWSRRRSSRRFSNGSLNVWVADGDQTRGCA